MREDDQRRKSRIEVSRQVIDEEKRNLKSGKTQIHGVVQNDGKVLPFAAMTDERGITHIAPQEKVRVELGPPKMTGDSNAAFREMLKDPFSNNVPRPTI